MLEASFMVDLQVQAKTFKQSFSLVRWATFRHSFSIGMQRRNDPLVGDRRYFIYRKGEGSRDPQMEEKGPHLKGKIPKGRIKDSKRENSTISLFNNNQLAVLEASSKRSFSSTLGKTS